MAKMTIYVPDDLRRRMDEAEGVNWSPLACQAFESKLAEIITHRGAKDMQDVVARLRASKAKRANHWVRSGREVGAIWAKDRAEVEKLELLSKLVESTDWPRMIIPGPDDAYGAGDYFVFALHPDEDRDRQKTVDFFSGLANPNEYHDPDFIQGFAEGALGIWEQVQDQVEAPPSRSRVLPG